MNTEKRKYSISDADMILTARIVSENFLNNIGQLTVLISKWNAEFAKDIVSRIEHVIDHDLKIDTNLQFRNASLYLSSVLGLAKRDLQAFKYQLELGMRSNPKKMEGLLSILGYDKYMGGLHSNHTESLIKLLYTFRRSMNGELKQEACSYGMSSLLIFQIIRYAQTVAFANFNVADLFPGTSDSKVDVVKMNQILFEIDEICDIASNFYQWNLIQSDLFDFEKTKELVRVTKEIPNWRIQIESELVTQYGSSDKFTDKFNPN